MVSQYGPSKSGAGTRTTSSSWRAAIDEIPTGINFEVSQSELQFPDEADLQLSQELDVHLSQQSNTGSISTLEEDDSFVGF